MADTNHSAPVLFPDRFVTIRESFRYNRDIPSHSGAMHLSLTTFPSMRISGNWLDEAGFAPPQRVRIEVTPGRLVLTPIAEEDCDHLGRDGFPIVDSATRLRRRARYPGKIKEKKEKSKEKTNSAASNH